MGGPRWQDSVADSAKRSIPVGTTEKLQLATELRDSIEIVHTSEYLNFLKAFFPAFRRVLAGTKPQFKDGDEHKLRNTVLEILNRLPHNEVIRPFSHDLMKICLGTLEADNEDNAMISLRIIFDLHKNFRPSLESEVRPFLDFVAKVSLGTGQGRNVPSRITRTEFVLTIFSPRCTVDLRKQLVCILTTRRR